MAKRWNTGVVYTTDIDEPMIRITNIDGFCPVQAEGEIVPAPALVNPEQVDHPIVWSNALKFYFRSRGGRWSMSIGGADPILNPLWQYVEDYAGEDPYAAGWIEDAEAKAFIKKAVYLFWTRPDEER